MKHTPFSYVLPEPLCPGCENDEVWLLQAMLAAISRHYVNLAQPSLNGVYDSLTTEAVKRVQRALGIADTGETNQETWDHIILMFCCWRE